MRSEEERFTPFICDESFLNMETYCRKEVEPMGRECEQVHIIALAEYMGVRVRIEYLDGRVFKEEDGLPCILCPTEDNNMTKIVTNDVPSRSYVTLLYRPGHYDILYM
jgi:ubiquitin thioesterase protein OTUB1